MHAVLLAGGKGTRLRPYTATVPKVLLPLDGVPVIELLIAQLREEGFGRITVVTGHLAEAVQQRLGNGERLGVRIDYLRETQPLDTAGCLGLMTLPKEPFLLINADIMTSFRFRDLLAAHQELQPLATVAVCRHPLSVDFGVVQFDAEGSMTGYHEKPTYELWVSMGIYCLDPQVCRHVARGESVSMPQLLTRLRDAGQTVRCHREVCYWRDIGRPEDYAQAQEDFARLNAVSAPRKAA